MKQRLSKYLVSFVFLVACSLGWNARALPPELSADMVMLHKNKVFDEGKFYIGKTASRLDLTKKAKQTQIFHFDADKIEVWVHQGKMIMEMKMQYNALINYKPAGFTEECVGEETIDGHPCQKCVMTGKFMGHKVKTTVWKAKDLKGMVIKNLDDKGNGNLIKNIALGPQPLSRFEAPGDYQRMSLEGGLVDIFKDLSK